MRALKQQNQGFVQNSYPSLIKYMGSKSKIMDFVLDGINHAYKGGVICDLFSGSGSLAGAIGQQCPVHSNDIQNYSQVLADTYNKAYSVKNMPTALEIIKQAKRIVQNNKQQIDLDFSYFKEMPLKEFNSIEKKQREFINLDFNNKWHLFVKNYSGTWWSYEQCLWIDALRQVAEKFKEEPYYTVILSSLMFSMAYASQGTGHYAQYREAKTKSSLNDIVTYRNRSIESYFIRKYTEISSYIPNNRILMPHKSTSLDYKECLSSLEEGTTVYADPPYCFVHYSRFYHALETLILYDYPTLQVQKGNVVKGRYREERHQSPFCIKTKVSGAFHDLFTGIKNSDSNLVLSYCNTGMISMDELNEIAQDVFSNKKIDILTTDHQHMTLGRKNDRQRDVKECLFLVY